MKYISPPTKEAKGQLLELALCQLTKNQGHTNFHLQTAQSQVVDNPSFIEWNQQQKIYHGTLWQLNQSVWKISKKPQTLNQGWGICWLDL